MKRQIGIPDELKAKVAERLTQLRLSIRDERGKKLTVEKAAKDLGMARTTLTNYETGTRVPNMQTLGDIAAYYGTSVEYLTCQTDDPRPSSLVDIKEALSTKTILWDNKELTDAEKEGIMKILETYLNK